MSDDMLAKSWHQGRHVNDMQLETRENEEEGPSKSLWRDYDSRAV